MNTREELDTLIAKGCSAPDCTHEDHAELYFHQLCHPKAAIEVSYKAGGELVVACFKCHKPIIRVIVATEQQAKDWEDE